MFSIIHRVLLEYLQNCDANQRSEMIDLLAEHLVHMIHTKDGAQVAMTCIWNGSAKVCFKCSFYYSHDYFNIMCIKL